MKRTEPSRPLLGTKPHKYVPACQTDVRQTFARWARLIRMQQRKENHHA